MENIKKVIESNRSIIDVGAFGEGVSPEWILKAEERLGIQFPDSYKYWLQYFGGGEINGEEVFSIYEIEFDEVVGGDVVYRNEIERKRNSTQKHELIIQENDQSSIYYFDLSKMNNGEAPVFVRFGEVTEMYANDFLEFLKKKVKE